MNGLQELILDIVPAVLIPVLIAAIMGIGATIWAWRKEVDRRIMVLFIGTIGFLLFVFVILGGSFALSYSSLMPKMLGRATETTTILVADFDGPSSEIYELSAILRDVLRARLDEDSTIGLEPLGRSISEVAGRDEARRTAILKSEGVIVWGWYAVSESVLLHFNVELLGFRDQGYFPRMLVDVRGEVNEPVTSGWGDYTLQGRIASELSELIVGVACYSDEDWPCAKESLDTIIGGYEGSILKLNNPEALYVLRGGAHYFDDQFDESVIDLEHALELNPKSAVAHYTLGYAYMNGPEPEYNEAENHFLRAIAENENYAEAYIGLAKVYSRQENYDQSITEFNKVEEIDSKIFMTFMVSDPDIGNAYYEIGLQAVRNGDFEAAKKNLSIAGILLTEEQEAESDLSYWLGFSWYKLGESGQAKVYLETYLSVGKNEELLESAELILQDL